MEPENIKKQLHLWKNDPQTSSVQFSTPIIQQNQTDTLSQQNLQAKPILYDPEKIAENNWKSNTGVMLMIYLLGCAIVMAVWAITAFVIHKTKFPWFIYPIASFTMLLEFQYYRIRSGNETFTKRDKAKNWFYFHLSLFITLNIVSLVTWYETSRYKLLWCVFPVMILAVPLLFHACKTYIPRQKFVPHIGMFLLVNGMFALAWYFSSTSYPWFIWIIGVWGVGLIVIGIVQWIRKRRRRQELRDLDTSRRRQSQIKHIPAPVVVDIPSPSYQVVTVQPEYSIFPSQQTTKSEVSRSFQSMPLYFFKKGYEPIGDPKEKTKKTLSMYY